MQAVVYRNFECVSSRFIKMDGLSIRLLMSLVTIVMITFFIPLDAAKPVVKKQTKVKKENSLKNNTFWDVKKLGHKKGSKGDNASMTSMRTRKVTDLVVGFSNSPEKSEKEAMSKATTLSANGIFKVLSINLLGSGRNSHCMLNIQHMTFPLKGGTKPVREMAVGFGRSRELALKNARYKIMSRINQNPDALTSDGMSLKDKDFILEFDFHVKGLRFAGSGNNIVCYSTFEYVEKTQ